VDKIKQCLRCAERCADVDDPVFQHALYAVARAVDFADFFAGERLLYNACECCVDG